MDKNSRSSKNKLARFASWAVPILICLFVLVALRQAGKL
jgi:hypothetical protein